MTDQFPNNVIADVDIPSTPVIDSVCDSARCSARDMSNLTPYCRELVAAMAHTGAMLSGSRLPFRPVRSQIRLEYLLPTHLTLGPDTAAIQKYSSRGVRYLPDNDCASQNACGPDVLDMSLRSPEAVVVSFSSCRVWESQRQEADEVTQKLLSTFLWHDIRILRLPVTGLQGPRLRFSVNNGPVRQAASRMERVARAGQ